jgi:hypothetical protein
MIWLLYALDVLMVKRWIIGLSNDHSINHKLCLESPNSWEFDPTLDIYFSKHMPMVKKWPNLDNVFMFQTFFQNCENFWGSNFFKSKNAFRSLHCYTFPCHKRNVFGCLFVWTYFCFISFFFVVVVATMLVNLKLEL